MIIYDGTYRLQRRDDKVRLPRTKWAKSWRIRIIDLSAGQSEVQYIRPVIVIATQSEEGIFKTTCAESIGRRICRDFNLKITEILWIEHYPDEPSLFVAMFTPKTYLEYDILYTVDWRPVSPNELKAIQPFIPELKNSPGA